MPPKAAAARDARPLSSRVCPAADEGSRRPGVNTASFSPPRHPPIFHQRGHAPLCQASHFSIDFPVRGAIMVWFWAGLASGRPGGVYGPEGIGG